MNSKLLYAATLAVSLISTLAVAQEAAPLSRAQVNAETREAIANGTLSRSDYDTASYRAPDAGRSGTTRAQVALELAEARAQQKTLIGPDADANYNPYGAQVHAVSTLARSTVKSEVLQAAAAGTLQRTDYDDPALAARNARQHVAAARLAQRLKDKRAHDAS